jgi:hypothetical protein
MTDKRPQVIAQKRFQEHRETLERMDLRERFEYIHEKNLWSNEESRSGIGSTLVETEALRKGIPALLEELGADSLLDIPCGDFHWLSEISLGVNYIGADIVGALVEANNRRFGGEGRRFVQLDLTLDPLPQANVVLCRDCLVHLCFANINRALENVKNSGARFLLTTHFPEIETNRDIEDGDWRPLNFELPPFRFPSPYRRIVESCEEAGGAYRDKSLGLWRVADL